MCTDVDEHRRRAEQRVADVDGLVLPTWEEIVNREYETWERDRVVVDTALLDVAESVRRIRSVVRP